MKEETTRLSASLEDYLKEIYLLNLEGQEVRITDIARSLGISKPSVNRAMNTLKELELLEHEHYGKITLTDAGRDTAKNILDTNKIVYRFLTEILDVDEQTALAEADLMEHDISKGTRKKLKKFIKKSTDKKSATKSPNNRQNPSFQNPMASEPYCFEMRDFFIIFYYFTLL